MFKSPTTGKECSAAQLIAEIMVKREIVKKKESPPIDFWNFAPWKKKYQQQIQAAHALLKVYSPHAILAALKRKECSWQYSLHVKNIADVIDEEQSKIDKELKQIQDSQKIETTDSNEFRQVNTGQKTLKSKLD